MAATTPCCLLFARKKLLFLIAQHPFSQLAKEQNLLFSQIKTTVDSSPLKDYRRHDELMFAEKRTDD